MSSKLVNKLDKISIISPIKTHYSPMGSNDERHVIAIRQTDVICSWVAVSERLPEIPKDAPSYAQHVKVIACWGNKIENAAQMDYCRRIVRGKEVYRFEWMGKISPWKVDYWMEFPKPPNCLYPPIIAQK